MARAQIVAPRALGIVEKLLEMGIIRSALYRLDPESAPHALPPTHDFANQPDLVDAAKAFAILEEADRLLSTGSSGADQLTAIDCVFTF